MSRVLVLGATGLLGQGVTKKLVEQGCTVIGTGRSGRGFPELQKMGVLPKQMDVLDRDGVDQVFDSVGHVDAVVNLMSKMPAKLKAFGADKEMDEYNKMRLLGTKHLMHAVERSRPGRVVAASHSYVCSPGGKIHNSNPGPDAGLNKNVLQDMLGLQEAYPGQYSDYNFLMSTAQDVTNRFSYATEYPWVDAPVSNVIQEFNGAAYRLERLTCAYKSGFGVVLRLGFLHGPGTAFGKGGAVREDVLSGKAKIIGSGGGQWSFVHVDDAIEALVMATTTKASGVTNTGVYNVVDPHPAATGEWMTRYAWAIGAAKKPDTFHPGIAKFFAPHLYFLSSMQRAAYYPPFPQHYGWTPKRGPMWEEAANE